MKRLTCILTVLLLFLAMHAAIADEPVAIRGWQKKEGWQYIQLGTYPTKADGTRAPVLWRVLGTEDGQALLLSDKILDVQQAIHCESRADSDHRRFRLVSCYEETDLMPWMNDVMLPNLCKEQDFSAALVECELGKLYPLRAAQFLREDYGFTRARYLPGEGARYICRQFFATPYAKQVELYPDFAKGAMNRLYVDSAWGTSNAWIADIRMEIDNKLGIVGFDGHLSYGVYTRVNIGVLPAMTLDLSLCTVIAGQGTAEDPLILSVPVSADASASDEKSDMPDWMLSVKAARQDEEVSEPEVSTAEEAAAETADDGPAEAEQAESLTENPATDGLQQEESAVMAEETAEEQAEAAAEPVPAKTSDSVTVSFLGDCSIGDSGQFVSYAGSYHSVVQEKGYAWPFSLVSDVLKADDLTVANLEAVLTKRTKHADIMYYLKADPSHVNILKEAGIEAVNTVNNHCVDFGAEGYLDTLDNLDAAGIQHFGCWRTFSENGRDDLLNVEIKGIRIGMIGFSNPQDDDLKRISARIKRLREAGCDLVFVSLHWGRETYSTPGSGQISYAKKVIDAGADGIWGHHAHVTQPIHFYKGKPILYSTGNFTFGTMSEVDPNTGIFQLTYHRSDSGEVQLEQLHVIPCRTQGKGDYRPYILTDASEIAQCLKRLRFTNETKNCQNLPESFLTTGMVNFVNGEMVTE